MTTSSWSVEEAKLKMFRDAQKADPVLTEYFKLNEADLPHKGMLVFPQGILYKVVNDKQLVMVSYELWQKILVENHDVPTTRHMGINWTVDLIKRAY